LNLFRIGGHLEVLGGLLAQSLKLGEDLTKPHDGLPQGRTSEACWPLPVARLTTVRRSTRPERRRCVVLGIVAVTAPATRGRRRRDRLVASRESTRDRCRIAHDTILPVIRSFVYTDK
jgi:hypothetical protein